MSVGRPSDFTEEKALEICDQLANGKSLRSICQQDDMPGQTTVFRWLEAHESFRVQYAYARELQADALFDETLDIADEKANDKTINADGQEVVNHEAIQRARLRIDTRKWMAGKLRPKKYGERQAMELSGPEGGPIETMELSGSEKLKAALETLAKRSGTDSGSTE